jgi:hypothetical protein
MALSKLKYNSLNVTAAANKGIGFDSDPDALQADYTGGSIIFIKKITASSSSTVSFVDGTSSVVLDNTYKEYLFTFNNIHPATDGAQLTINGSADSGSNYNVTKTTTVFSAQHNEDDNDTNLVYGSDKDMAQGTGAAIISFNSGNDNDQCTGGYLHLFNPSSTVFVKHFISVANTYHSANYSINTYAAGYFNTTSAVDAIQFAMDSGNIDAGDICLYGIN